MSLARIVRNLENCARCGDDHEALQAMPFSKPPKDFNYWATCPVTRDPILIQVSEEKEDDPT